MTAGERLLALAGTTGTAATLLLLIGSGATAGAALVVYSKLGSATAAAHLLTDVAPAAPASPMYSGGGGYVGGRMAYPRIRRNDPRRKQEDEMTYLLLL